MQKSSTFAGKACEDRKKVRKMKRIVLSLGKLFATAVVCMAAVEYFAKSIFYEEV